MTNQETFDKVVLAIRRQGGASLSGNGCAYRGDNGRKCAAGHLLNDDQVVEKMGVLHGYHKTALEANGHAVHLVFALQRALGGW